MKLPPINYLPTTGASVRNGTATRSLHALEVDRGATFLAVHKRPVPALMGPFVSGTTYDIVMEVPAYTQHVRWGFWASGRGTVTVTSGDDSYNTVTDVQVGSGAVGTHSREADGSSLVWTDGPVTVSASGTDRSIDVDFQSSTHQVVFTFVVADESGSLTLEVYGITPRWLPPDESAELPA